MEINHAANQPQQLSDDAQLTMAELETSKVKNRRGITRLSGSQIRRLEAQGIFRETAKSQARNAASMWLVK